MPPNNWDSIIKKAVKRTERLTKQWKDGKVIHPLEGDVDTFVGDMLRNDPENENTPHQGEKKA